MDSRLKLHELLVEIVAEVLDMDDAKKRVFFQPPTNIKLSYPCILYRLSSDHSISADNLAYLRKHVYTVTVIDRDPDSKLRDVIAELPYCKMGNPFNNSNLYHYPFTIYW